MQGRGSMFDEWMDNKIGSRQSDGFKLCYKEKDTFKLKYEKTYESNGLKIIEKQIVELYKYEKSLTEKLKKEFPGVEGFIYTLEEGQKKRYYLVIQLNDGCIGVFKDESDKIGFSLKETTYDYSEISFGGVISSEILKAIEILKKIISESFNKYRIRYVVGEQIFSETILLETLRRNMR